MAANGPQIDVSFHVLQLLKKRKKVPEVELVAQISTLLNQTTVLDLSTRNTVGANSAKLLAKALKHNQTLKQIFINNNPIGNDGAVAIAESLHNHPTINLLSLDNIGATDPTAYAIEELLTKNHTITLIMLSSNNITLSGAQSLINGIKQNSSLRGLNLFQNPIPSEYREQVNAALADKERLQLPKNHFFLGHVLAVKSELPPALAKHVASFASGAQLLQQKIAIGFQYGARHKPEPTAADIEAAAAALQAAVEKDEKRQQL